MPRFTLRRLPLLLFLLLCTLPRALADPPIGGPIVAHFPSQKPSGNAVNDQIWVTFYPAAASAAFGSASRPAPAIVLLHPIGETPGGLLERFMQRLAEQFAARGIGCALMSLPYHLQRTAPGAASISHFIGPRVSDVTQAFAQSASDVSTVTDWLSARPDVDRQRLGVVGISLGAIVAHLAMGQDARLNAGVALEGGGDLPTLYRDSLEVRLHGHYSADLVTPASQAMLAEADPAHYAAFNHPRHVLMIAAARDQYVPPANALFLWNALGRPPIQWTDTNHFTFLLAGPSFAQVAAVYLNRVWSGHADDPAPLPRYTVPTIKLGFLFELNGNLTPTLTWQAYSFASRPDHLSLAHLDLGESGRGPFVGVAATLSRYLDVGMEHRFSSRAVQPYVELHYVF